MTDLDEKALEAAATWQGVDLYLARSLVARYLATCVEQGIVLVDVRMVAQWLREQALEEVDRRSASAAAAIEARFAPGIGGER